MRSVGGNVVGDLEVEDLEVVAFDCCFCNQFSRRDLLCALRLRSYASSERGW